MPRFAGLCAMMSRGHDRVTLCWLSIGAGVEQMAAPAAAFSASSGCRASQLGRAEPRSFRVVRISDSFLRVRGFCRQQSLGVRAQQANMGGAAVAEKQQAEAKGGAVKRVPRVLSVAGSDSGGGAGIQADIKACAALGVFCSTAITALTAQNTVGVQGIHAVPAEFVEAQIKSVLSDIGADVVKTGMLASGSVIRGVVAGLKASHFGAVVVDPVLVATSGDSLADSDVLQSFRDVLFPIADLVTPNVVEASSLLNGKAITTLDDMREAAVSIHQMGPRCVLIKGGHLPGSGDVVDILFDGHECHELHGPRIVTRNTHGTGCTLASSIAAEIAKGSPMLKAVKDAKQYVGQALQHSAKLQVGQGVQGPMNHLFMLSTWQESSPREKFKGEDLLLYAVTDPDMNKRWGRSTPEAVLAAIKGGATFLQIREKESDTGQFLADAEASVKVAREHGVPLVINDRVDIALACDADGVHLGQSDMPAARARSLLGANKIIGVSCKTPEQARRAWEEGADYVGSGGVYPTNTKKGNLTIGLDGLREVCRQSPVPVVAIGGIKAHNALEVMKDRLPSLGGVAVVSELFDQPDVLVATQRLRASLNSCL